MKNLMSRDEYLQSMNEGFIKDTVKKGWQKVKEFFKIGMQKIKDFIAVFDASKTASYAYPSTTGYPFAADETWDSERNAKSCVVKVSDGSLCYTNDGSTVGTAGTPVVRNRQSVVIAQINGLYQNGYHTADIAWQY